MFQKIKAYFSHLKAAYRSHRADILFKKADQQTAGHPDRCFLSWPTEKQLAVLDKINMPQVFHLMSGVTADDTRTDFEKMPDLVREKGLSLLPPDLQKRVLLMRANDKNRYSLYNFLSAPREALNTFFTQLTTPEEQISLLQKPMGETNAMTVLIEKNSGWADLIAGALQSRAQMDALFGGERGYRWPEWSLETTQTHLLSLVPFADLTAFLKKQTPSGRTVFESLPFSVQKETVHRYNGHPHLMQRLMADGLMNHVGWPIKREIALQMNNKKYLLALFKTPSDETGRKAFYATPYDVFRKAVYRKFPELDIYPRKVKNKPNAVVQTYSDKERSL